MQQTIGAKYLRSLIRKGAVSMAGNRKLLIYGLLNCRSGKRMNPPNRVFFASEEEARASGYRPCGHCMKKAFLQWKADKK